MNDTTLKHNTYLFTVKSHYIFVKQNGTKQYSIATFKGCEQTICGEVEKERMMALMKTISGSVNVTCKVTRNIIHIMLQIYSVYL